MLAQSCRSSKERTLFVVALVFCALVWLALVVTLVGLLYAPFVALAVVVGHTLFLARLTGHSIRVGSRTRSSRSASPPCTA
jgi:peptidoglycan biosynthesis protein MviN/MurJ (putative lipid II flippase)